MVHLLSGSIPVEEASLNDAELCSDDHGHRPSDQPKRSALEPSPHNPDPFHVVSWVTDALDEVRRDVWNASRHSGNKALAGELKGARYALWKNPENLSSDQRFRLAIVAKINHPLYKAYLLKEQLRLVFRLPTRKALALLDSWLAWASRSRLAPFVEAAKTIRAHRSAIEATLVQGCSRKGRAQCS